MIIDLDSHLRDGYFLDEIYRLEGPLARFTPRRIGEGKYQAARFEHVLDPEDAKVVAAYRHGFVYDPELKWRGGEVAERQVGGYDMARRMRDVEREGFDMQFLFPTGIRIPTQNVGALGAALARCYNDWVHRLVEGYRDRLFPVAIAPAGCPDQMADELRRCVRELGFKAGHLVAWCGPRNLDDPVFYPYYQAAEELDVPLFCHPNSEGDLINRFDNHFKMHVLGRPLNCTAALVALVLGGVFERFPKLRVVFFECSAEWIVYWMHRMDDDYEHMGEHFAPFLTMKPSEYVKRNCYVTCEVDEKLLPLALEEIGEGHVVLASDYPHYDSEFPHTVSSIRSRPDLTARQKERILGENARELLRL